MIWIGAAIYYFVAEDPSAGWILFWFLVDQLLD